MKFLLAILVAGAALFLFVKWRSASGDKPAGRRKAGSAAARPANLDEPQIILRPGPGACNTARQQAGRSFNGVEGRRLPLPGCRSDTCTCRFETITGRRRGQRRQSSDRREDIRFGEDVKERRGGRDRRSSGADPWGVDRE